MYDSVKARLRFGLYRYANTELEREVAGWVDEQYEDDLMRRLVASRRTTGFAEAMRLRDLAEFAAARPGQKTGERFSEWAADEIAVAMRWTRNMASAQLHLAMTVTSRLPGTLAALSRGEVDLRGVKALADITDPLDDATAKAVETAVLPKAGKQNVSELRRAARRAVLRLDPAGAQARHEQRRKQRRIELAPLEDAMAELTAILPAPDATAIYRRLNDFAHAAPADDGRTMDQRRADIFTDLLLGDPITTGNDTGDGDGDGDGTGKTDEERDWEERNWEERFWDANNDSNQDATSNTNNDSDQDATSSEATTSATRGEATSSSATGGEATRSSDASHDNIAAATSDNQDATSNSATGDAGASGSGGHAGRDSDAGASGSDAGASGSGGHAGDASRYNDAAATSGDGDETRSSTAGANPNRGHTTGSSNDNAVTTNSGTTDGDDQHVSDDQDAASDGASNSGGNNGLSSGVSGDDSRRGGTAGASRSSGHRGRGVGTTKTLVQVTVPISTLMGLDDEPGELAGYGPIPAGLARDIAAGGTWKRLLTDPVSGTLLDYGRTTYRPPAGLADFVRARDHTCVFPGCSRPADACDIDHRKPHPEGHTSEENLQCLCRHHHRLKHEAGWTVEYRNGTHIWTTPDGHRYHREPHPIAQPTPQPPPPPTKPSEEPPPF